MLNINTFFRKADYDGDVHLLYLDEIYGKLGVKIENELSYDVLNSMTLHMIRSYCLLTKKYSLLEYSSVVKQALNFIYLNISSNLTAKRVASEVSLSPDYLTHLFKK